MTKTEELYVQLLRTVTRLEEGLDNARSEIKRVDTERSKVAESLIDLDRKFAVIEDNVKELKKLAEERDRRRWTIVLAAFGCLLTLAANVSLTYFRLNK